MVQKRPKFEVNIAFGFRLLRDLKTVMVCINHSRSQIENSTQVRLDICATDLRTVIKKESDESVQCYDAKLFINQISILQALVKLSSCFGSTFFHRPKIQLIASDMNSKTLLARRCCLFVYHQMPDACARDP